jgi:hypothetical protein
MVEHSVSNEMQECINHCFDAQRICLESLNYCLERGGEYVAVDLIRLLIDCAEICQTNANFMLRNSNLHISTCWVCAEVCESCADECDGFDDNDAQLTACVDVLRRCADSCDRIAAVEEESAAA